MSDRHVDAASGGLWSLENRPAVVAWSDIRGTQIAGEMLVASSRGQSIKLEVSPWVFLVEHSHRLAVAVQVCARMNGRLAALAKESNSMDLLSAMSHSWKKVGQESRILQSPLGAAS